MRILLTGGCGFIGSAVVRHLIRNTAHSVINIDKMTYAASEPALEEARRSPRHVLVSADVADAPAMEAVFTLHRPDAVMHLAAETHVDRSIDGPRAFVETNVVGTYVLLNAARAYWSALATGGKEEFRFHHVSTDEVFGALGAADPPFTEATPYSPRSPYAASKAASDHLVRAWFHTYGLPTTVSNTTNNYGPWQFPEKLVPLITINALEGKPLPVYGSGANRRDWLYVDDHAEALVRVLERGTPGATYCIGGCSPTSNLEIVELICRLLDELAPDPEGPHARRIRFVADRPGHDFRYEIDPTPAEVALSWRARHDLAHGLRRTLGWYLANRAWWQQLRATRYGGERLGTAA
ncbi:MAG: dTDP-glucose 4,6-dehydratase [Acetobacteraceae bacterium]